MNIVTKKIILFLSVLMTSTSAWSSTSVVLKSDDFVGITFWLISMALVAATAFFFLETQRVEGKWKTSLVVSGLVTMVAAVHYFYMREVWIQTGDTPTVYRYIDWLITVPLLMVEFYLILAAITKVPNGVFWRLMVGTLVMLVSGYLGEVGVLGHGIGFFFGMVGWFYIIYEIFYGEAGKISAAEAPESVKKAYNLMRLIVTIGWSVYPIGYFVGYLAGIPAESSMAGLNVVYNLADVVNKIAFGVIIWTAASAESFKTK
ncbi:MAG: biphenyl 2,3-dioxygenase [Gammaproteobacteria bacterium]|nr:biphenyl 2,3-dioxygenase [Gammaproteobacteria bacterium]NBY23797.1 biphenyl 2,3-dioxygenase [Gammaproteobacteria bacterium]